MTGTTSKPRPWKPSKRATELIAAMWDAYEDHDRWIRLTQNSTARYTGVSLVYNGIAEFDMSPEYASADGSYSTRIRLSEALLNDNGLTHENEGWRTLVAEYAELDALDAAERIAA